MLSCGWEEYVYLDYIKGKVNENPFLLDVGANRGDFTKAFLEKYPTGSAYCYEPMKVIYELLEKRFLPDERVATFNFGFYNEEMYNKKFYYVKNSDGMSSLHYRPAYYPKFDVEEITVDMTILDTVRDLLPEVDFMKLDTEGSEYFVLDGAREFLKETPPKFIQFEVGECYIDSHTTFKQVVDLLYSFDYKIFNNQFNLITPTNVWENYDCQNYLAVLNNE
jgi:FkbM family methyltransferase